MTRASAHIVGAYEYPARRVEDATVAGIAQDVAIGALDDAGLTLDSVDALFCDTTAGVEPVALAELLGLDHLRYLNSTDVGGSSYLYHVGQAVQALESGVCDVALVVMAGLATRKPPAFDPGRVPGAAYEPSGVSQPSAYALVAQRHMYEYGTTSEQLAAVRVAASTHAQYNPLARFRDPVTVDDVLSSPMISDPLHRLDCCITTDGGGALVLVSSRMAGSIERAGVGVRGYGFALAHNEAGFRDITISAAVGSGRDAFAMAGVKPADIGYASIYDSFTITVVVALEDLGFCKKGEGGPFVAEGSLLAPDGVIPFNTDGGGLCNNHPGRRGGMVRTLEAVRQLRREAAPEVQVDADLGLVHGTGGNLGGRHACATLVLEAPQ